MKKLLSLLLASFVVLAACGQEESKSEDKKETKASDKESEKDNKKSNDHKESDKDKSDDKSNEEVASQDKTTEQPVQSQEQVNTQEQQTTQQPVQSQEQAPITEGQQNSDGHTYHYDPEYDTYGYTGQVTEDGMPVLDPNENVDTHGGQVPNDNLTDAEIKEMMGE